MTRKTLVLSFVLAATFLALGVQALLRDDTAPVAPRAVAQPATATPMPATPFGPIPVTEHSDLRDALKQEIAAREQLAQTVARLEKEIRELKAGAGDNAVTRTQVSTAIPPDTTTDAPRRSRARDTSAPVDDSALLAFGVSPLEVKQIRERFEQLEMDRLYLRDRAQREGWSGTARYSNELAKIQDKRNELRNSFSENTWDAYLYASGEPNRVVIREMLQGSPAAAAGLQPGDTVLRYADKRVYTTRELQEESRKGRAGENVAVVIERDGQLQTVYIPRGPLGVYLDAESRKP